MLTNNAKLFAYKLQFILKINFPIKDCRTIYLETAHYIETTEFYDMYVQGIIINNIN